MEQNFQYLEEKNKELTAQLMRRKADTLRRTFTTDSKNMIKKVWEAWTSIRNLCRYEQQFEEQTRSIKKIKEVSRELGTALAKEQEVAYKSQHACQQLEADIENAAAANFELQQHTENQAAEIELLERQMQLLLSTTNGNQRHVECITEDLRQLRKSLKNGDW